MINMNVLNKPKKYNVVINEIMSNPMEIDYYEWIEFYNRGDDVNLKGWTVSNSDGNAIATLPDWVFPQNTYLIVNFNEGINDDDFSDGNATFYVGSNQEFFDDTMDACALYVGIPSDSTIVDFISYCYDGNYEPGIAHDFAVNAKMWDLEEFFDTISSRLPLYFLQVIAFPGDTIARDADSTDTDVPGDWMAMGGIDSYKPTPGAKNLQLIEWEPSEMDQDKNTLEIPEEKGWTVMVYIAVDINTKKHERQVLRYINEMEKLGSTDFINIVVQVDFNKVCSGETRRSYITKDDNLNKITSFYNKISERNTGDPTHLSEFVNWSMEEYPASKYALFLVGHGAGWKGLLKDSNSNGQTITPDWLYMWELKQALDFVPLIDLVCFNNCLMGTVEVAWQIHGNADVMVASQELMNIKGFPYYKILENLNGNRYFDTEEFAENIVDLYYQFYSDKKTYDPCHTLSAIRLDEQLNHLISAIDQASQSLIDAMDDWGDEYNNSYVKHDDKFDNCQMDVKSSLLATEYFADRNYKDLYDLAHNIRYNNGIYWRYSMDCPNIKKELEDVIIIERHGDRHYKSHGLSIYFPRDQVYFRKYPSCNGKEKWESPFDYPKPSKKEDWSGKWRLYAEDHTIDNGKVPYFGDSPHPWPETPNLLFRDHTRWGEFLHRYYKPCADAGKDQTKQVADCDDCVQITLNGDGSSSADDDLKVHRYTWDFDAKVDSKPEMDPNMDDMDRNGIDDLDDELDDEGVEVTHAFCVGTHIVTLTVWDDHHTIEDLLTNNHKNEHWKTDQDICIITVKCQEDDEEPDTHITSPQDGATVTSPINVTGYATDYGGSGVAELDYLLEWNGGSYDGDSIYIDPPEEEQGFILGPLYLEDYLDLEDEWLKITIYVIDAAGNTGSDSITVYRAEREDTTPPITTATFDPELRVVTLTAYDPPHGDDPISGVCATYYYIDDGTTQEYFEPFPLPEGAHDVTFWSVDCADNVEDPNTETFG